MKTAIQKSALSFKLIESGIKTKEQKLERFSEAGNKLMKGDILFSSKGERDISIIEINSTVKLNIGPFRCCYGVCLPNSSQTMGEIMIKRAGLYVKVDTLRTATLFNGEPLECSIKH